MFSTYIFNDLTFYDILEPKRKLYLGIKSKNESTT